MNNRGSTVYLTPSEKEAICRAIDQYITDVEGSDDKLFVAFYLEHDEHALISALKKLRRS